MHKPFTTSTLILVLILIFVLVLAFATFLVQNNIENTESVTTSSFVLVDKLYSESTGILTIYLQYFGSTLEFVTEKDFEWYLNEQKMGSVNLVSFGNGSDKTLKNGDTVQIDLKIEEIHSEDRIKLTFRNSFQIIISL
jgi:hypothetical protein